MKMSLRKARKLEQEIKNYLNTNSLDTNLIALAKTARKDVQELVSITQQELSNRLDDHMKLNDLRFSLRQTIGRLNEECGINALMVQKEQLQAKKKVYEELGTSHYDEKFVMATMERQMNLLEKGESRYADVNVSIRCPSEKMVNQWKESIKSLKKEIDSVEEKLIKKNAGVEVTLPQSEVELLQSFGLV